ncbi:MAG: SAM-dependent chlorinase/fluorinase [Bacteroidales bacterium]|nr:SAM-dependent chlorinase/fluorinase [Bacteroidales bacterium]
MAIITLTTDWKDDDYYIGCIKGALLSTIPGCVIIDISHQIKSFNILQAAFVLRNCYKNYPEGTVHIICVNSEIEKDQRHVLVKTDNQYFIGTDNGIFSLLFKDKVDLIIDFTNEKKKSTFPELDLFVDIAAQIQKSMDIKSLGKTLNEFQKRIPLRATIDDSVITGGIIHIDSYRNVITNISRELFERVGNNRPFELFVQSNSYKIRKINTYYNETSPGELLALFNSLDLLEIAINKGNAADLLNLSTNSSVRIKFQ